MSLLFAVGIKAATFIIAPGDDGPLGSITLSKDHATMEHMADISIAVQPSEQAVPLILSSQKSESIGPVLRSKRRVTATKRGPDQILESRDPRPTSTKPRGEVRPKAGARFAAKTEACAMPGLPGGRTSPILPPLFTACPRLSRPLPLSHASADPALFFPGKLADSAPTPLTAYSHRSTPPRPATTPNRGPPLHTKRAKRGAPPPARQQHQRHGPGARTTATTNDHGPHSSLTREARRSIGTRKRTASPGPPGERSRQEQHIPPHIAAPIPGPSPSEPATKTDAAHPPHTHTTSLP